jgi:D-alanyl-D-alanine dipeptidase
MTRPRPTACLAFSVLALAWLPTACTGQSVPAVDHGPVIAPPVAPPPPGLVDITQTAPGILIDVRYATSGNFTGEVLDGYRAPRVFLMPKTAAALKAVQAELAGQGWGLKIFDGYRPRRAEKHMIRWAETGGHQNLLKAGYLPTDADPARRFGHACGNTVDLTLVSADGRELDMGTDFDAFTRDSWTENAAGEVLENRRRLKAVMEKHGFKNYSREWWHYNFYPEPGRSLDDEIR